MMMVKEKIEALVKRNELQRSAINDIQNVAAEMENRNEFIKACIEERRRLQHENDALRYVLGDD